MGCLLCTRRAYTHDHCGHGRHKGRSTSTDRSVMAYLILSKKTRWRLVWRQDRGKNGVIQRTIFPHLPEYGALGFRAEMGIEEARTTLSRVRLTVDEVEKVGAFHRAQDRAQLYKAVESIYLPPIWVQEYEKNVLPCISTKLGYWTHSQKIVASWGVEPQYWFTQPNHIVQYISERGMAPYALSTCNRIINAYGLYYCAKLCRIYTPVVLNKPAYNTVNKAYNASREGREWVACSPHDLKRARTLLGPLKGLWVAMAFWYGLRPEEMALWEIKEASHGAYDRYLLVRQKKLKDKGVEERLCWKAIPAVEPEQREIMSALEGGACPVRPTAQEFYRVKKGLSPRTCRRGYVAIMRERGYCKNIYNTWMGHLNSNTQDRNYVDPKKPEYERPIRGREPAHGDSL